MRRVSATPRARGGSDRPSHDPGFRRDGRPLTAADRPAPPLAARGVGPALLGVVLIWGGTYSAVTAVQAVMPPLALATFRAVAGALVLVVVMALLGAPRPRLSRGEWLRVLLLGLTGTSAFQLCMVGGLRLTTPAHAALMIQLNPVFTALLAAVWLGERLRLARALGILVSLAGALIVIYPIGDAPAGTSIVGDLVTLGAGLAWAIYSVAGKPLLATRASLEVATLGLAVGALALLPFGAPGLVAVPWRALSGQTWALLVYLSAGSLSVTYVLWYWALARAATARVTVFSYLVPVLATGLSIALGQEVLTGRLVLGAATVIGGVALAQRE